MIVEFDLWVQKVEHCHEIEGTKQAIEGIIRLIYELTC